MQLFIDRNSVGTDSVYFQKALRTLVTVDSTPTLYLSNSAGTGDVALTCPVGNTLNIAGTLTLSIDVNLYRYSANVLKTDDNLQVVGYLAATGNITGPNVTSGSDPGHTHTAYSVTSHNHDHGALGGRADDDHTQYLLASGARALSANWDAGSYYIRASYFYSDVATGTRPLVCTSTTTCTNLNADLLDGNHSTAFAPSSHSHATYALTTHTHTTLGALTTSGALISSYNGANIRLNGTSGGSNIELHWQEAGANRWSMYFAPSLATDEMGLYRYTGTAMVMFKCVNNNANVLANATWADNQFNDYVCAVCGWHSVACPDDNLCPACGGRVEWHDDAELLHLAIHQPQANGVERLRKLGVLHQDHDGTFIGMQTAHLFTWSAIAQLWERLRAAEARVAVLEGGL